MLWAELVVNLLAAYAVLGTLFAIAFLASGITRVDPAAAGSSLGFRLIILPGVVLLWPVLLGRWLKGGHRE